MTYHWRVIESSSRSSTWVWVAMIGLLVLVLGLGAAVVAMWSNNRVGAVDAAPVVDATEARVTAEPVASAPERTAGASEIARTWGDSVYLITADGCGVVSGGSGWVLDEDHIVTNWHVVNNDLTPTVTDRQGRTMAASVIGGGWEPDIAVLRVEGDLAEPLSWADTSGLVEGQDLVAMGYPAPAGDFTVTPSTVLSFQKAGEQRQAIRTDGQLDKGNSGGPALTLDGRVAGVVTQMAMNEGGFQLVPLIFTADALEATVAGIVADPGDVEPECDDQLPSLPEDWYGEWEDYEVADVPFGYGDDAQLDALVDACTSGDMDACDELYWAAGFGTDYEGVATSCGGASHSGYGTCAWAADIEAEAAEQAASEASALAAFASSCEGGDMQACDDLAWDAEYGSAEYELAQTCGGHYPDGWGNCVSRARDAEAEAAAAELVASLVASCEGGDMQACDDLFWEAPYGSAEYEVVESCGGHYPDGFGDCVDRAADALHIDELRSSCAAGDFQACDDLWFESWTGSEDAQFGLTCGNRIEPAYGECARILG